MTRAFVLSGGASLGAIQAGMLQALFERRVTADLIVGSQAGAINGAFIASREQTVQTAEALGDLWHELRRGVFPSNPLTALIGVMGRGDRGAAQNPLRKVVNRHLQADRLQDMSVPLHLVATDVLSGEELRLSSGPALDAVMASAAMPGVFAPVQFGGHADGWRGVGQHPDLARKSSSAPRRSTCCRPAMPALCANRPAGRCRC